MRVLIVRESGGKRIVEDGGCFAKIDGMLLEIGRGLPAIPRKYHGRIIRVPRPALSVYAFAVLFRRKGPGFTAGRSYRELISLAQLRSLTSLCVFRLMPRSCAPGAHLFGTLGVHPTYSLTTHANGNRHLRPGNQDAVGAQAALIFDHVRHCLGCGFSSVAGRTG